MTTRTTRASVLVAILFLSVAMLSCTGTEILEPGSFPFKFETAISNASPANYVCTTLNFTQVRILPLDPLAADPLSGEAIGLVTAAVNDVSFKDTPCEFISTLELPTATLPAGEYMIDTFNFGEARFHDGTTEISCFSSVNYVDSLTEPVVFTIGPGRANSVRLVLNEEALAQDQIDTFLCADFFSDPRPFFTIEPQ